MEICFGGKIQTIFYGLIGNKNRNPEQITLERHDMRLKITEFGRIYNNLNNLHKSWLNDFDVFNATMKQYEKATLTRKAFPYVQLWLKLKVCPKWNVLKNRLVILDWSIHEMSVDIHNHNNRHQWWVGWSWRWSTSISTGRKN